jgi:hypothetical protein
VQLPQLTPLYRQIPALVHLNYGCIQTQMKHIACYYHSHVILKSDAWYSYI